MLKIERTNERTNRYMYRLIIYAVFIDEKLALIVEDNVLC